ncbi:MAG: DNA polymerase III subunit alpha [Deltaproteobacteria bacterium]|nr:DNA polymerase III subunit alpha [Deltaproteobacteria bacterium]
MRAEYETRIDSELELITERGFAAYLLIVQDFMNWARRHDIPVGPGRGSAAGSLVCYALGITDIDPLRYGLLFERFLNPERHDNPDIDCDFCAHGRDRVIEYVTEKYGKDSVCQIGTFATLKAKAVVRDVGRALGYPYAEVDKVAKLIPFDPKITIADAIEKNSEFRDFIEENAWARELTEHAKALEGLTRHIGKHAAGVVIAPAPLTEFVPLTRDKDGHVITQWDMKDVEAAKLIKFDFLGLKNLTIIDKALKLIERNHGVRIDMDAIPMDDAKTFELLAKGHTTGVFQLESGGMTEVVVRIAPSSVDEIIALVALYRPGPMRMIDDYIASKKGEKTVTYELPVLEKYLKETYGLMVYQEQVMQVVREVGGFSLGASDLLRRAIGKKKREQVEQFRTEFLDGAANKGISRDKAEKIWDLIDKFAEYGFNKSHSAAYGVLAYQTAYLKANYPNEYMAAVLTMNSDNTDKLYPKINEVREMGMEILPPDVNRSERDFIVEDGKIRFGLIAVKNVGEGTIQALVHAREEHGEFQGLFHFLEHVDPQHVNKRVMESLIKGGCFDKINPNRAQLLAGLDAALEHASRRAKERASGQGSLFGGMDGAVGLDQAGDALPDTEPWTDSEQLDGEKTAFGFFLTGHPLRQYASIIKQYTNLTCAGLKDEDFGTTMEATMAVIISGRRFIDTVRGRMAILEAEDLTGTFEAVVYSDVLARHDALIRSEEPILLAGTAENQEKGPRMVVKKIVPLAEAQKNWEPNSIFVCREPKWHKARLRCLKRYCLMRDGGNAGRCSMCGCRGPVKRC